MAIFIHIPVRISSICLQIFTHFLFNSNQLIQIDKKKMSFVYLNNQSSLHSIWMRIFIIKPNISRSITINTTVNVSRILIKLLWKLHNHSCFRCVCLPFWFPGHGSTNVFPEMVVLQNIPSICSYLQLVLSSKPRYYMNQF